jgi:hypothetical protein
MDLGYQYGALQTLVNIFVMKRRLISNGVLNTRVTDSRYERTADIEFSMIGMNILLRRPIKVLALSFGVTSMESRPRFFNDL